MPVHDAAGCTPSFRVMPAPLTLDRQPSPMERSAARRRIAAGTLVVALVAGIVAWVPVRDDAMLRALGASVVASLAVLVLVGAAWGLVLGMVVVLEPLTRGGRLAGFALEGALHELLPFGIVTLLIALTVGLPAGGALHLRALPLLATSGALVGVLRWVIAGRGQLRA